jgi:hypothetical protein
VEGTLATCGYQALQCGNCRTEVFILIHLHLNGHTRPGAVVLDSTSLHLTIYLSSWWAVCVLATTKSRRKIFIKKIMFCWVPVLTPVSPALQKAEIRRISGEDQPKQKVLERPHFKQQVEHGGMHL